MGQDFKFKNFTSVQFNNSNNFENETIFDK